MTNRRPRAAAIREIGATIDEKYRITGLIGAGSTGDVFRATRTADGATVALKVLDPALSRDERQVERFRREAAVCIRLHHPHTVRVIDYGRFIDGRLFLAMEYLDGLTLAETLRRRRPLAVARACDIARQVAEALSEAHENDIVHRDVKPDNIFLARIGGAVDFVKILDFGIARFVGDGAVQQTLTRTGFVAGTPLYLSPEQGLGKRLDGRSDLYSLGVVLYEMVTGRPPFVAETPIALVLKHIHETPPPPATVNPAVSLPPRLEELLRALLAKNRDHRPRDAHTVSRLLEEIESVAAAQIDVEAPAPRNGSNGEAASRDRLARLHALPLTRMPDGDFASDEEAFQELAALLRRAMGGSEGSEDRDEADDPPPPAPPAAAVAPPLDDVAPGSPELPVVVLEPGDAAASWAGADDERPRPPAGPQPPAEGPGRPAAGAPDEALVEALDEPPDELDDLPFVPHDGGATAAEPALSGPADRVPGPLADRAALAEEAPPPLAAPQSPASPQNRVAVAAADSLALAEDLPEEPTAPDRSGLLAVVLLLLLGIAGLLIWIFVAVF